MLTNTPRFTNTPHLTILLPFYQAGAEMDLAVSSLVEQSFSDWKLILVSNNGSITGLDIARKWMAKDERIIMVEEPQQGIAYALNQGLRYADTPYIARMDADDISFSERLLRQVDYLDCHPDIDVVSCQTEYQSHIPGSKRYSLFVDGQNAIISPDDHAREQFVESPIAHPTVIFRKELIDRYGSYDTGEVPEDYELWLRWMDQGVRLYKIP